VTLPRPRPDAHGGNESGTPDGPDGADGADGADEVLAAMADPTRRRLLEDLAARGGATATDLADGLPISRQAVVKHLAVLGRAGLVTARRQGREVRYLARPDGVAATARWMAALAADWDQRLAAIKNIAEALPAPSGQAAGERPVGGHDPDAEWDQRHRDDLEAGDAERDADDREA
jgi:DNA-binding transcriptional ArsR family regulator